MQGVQYFVRASAFNVKGWGPPSNASPASATPSSEYTRTPDYFDECGCSAMRWGGGALLFPTAVPGK